MKYLNPERICKYQNKKVLLEFNDKLYMAEKDNAGEVHSNYSKIKIVAIDYSKGKKEDAVEAHFNLDPSKIKLIENKLNRFFPPIFEEKGNNESELIIGFGKYKNKTPSLSLSEDGEKAIEELQKNILFLQQNLSKYPINKKKIEQIENAIKKFQKGEIDKNTNQTEILFYTETKINPYSIKENVSKISIKYNARMENAWQISIENGHIDFINGESKKETYKRLSCVNNIYIADEKFRELILFVNDYVRHKELIFISKLSLYLNEYRDNCHTTIQSEN